jgi:hypothetical protein
MTALTKKHKRRPDLHKQLNGGTTLELFKISSKILKVT